ncbi:Methylthioribose-1-phosphate isomerase [Halomicronema hongdechloris C2206]|uniref:Methylthioribose-1-phosphate isomerase n=1 Tax=Halomicronema hongdechloris C2206 TaxID=1641165 RepID=A0A1Z3HMW8_9CYAN|nr:S-methyl-5-thioribose-1-phosphate isomerase [Halomicronema hongdechloris]ASC71487.1 Methylthioribose-1-phosphate isomerase [Halomicronema hongdechloris C2206]
MVDSVDTHVYPVVWQTDHVLLVDQNKLPEEYTVVSISRCDDMMTAIRSRIVAGESAIGIAAAYGVYLGASEMRMEDRQAFLERLEAVAEQLRSLRPDKTSLQRAMERMMQVAIQTPGSVESIRERLLQTAQAMQTEDLHIGHAIGDHGLAILPSTPDQLTLFTHCNHGALATAGYGTSLAVVRTAWQQGRLARVYAGETRPRFQGSRLTPGNGVQEGIPVTVVTDSAAARCMQEGRIHAVLAGADRIAANGDVINKIGTYGLALIAKAHDVPFLVAAPLSTVDFSLPGGEQAAIATAAPAEIARVGGKLLTPKAVECYNPTADVTPAELITAIVTEQGAIAPTDLHAYRDQAR